MAKRKGKPGRNPRPAPKGQPTPTTRRGRARNDGPRQPAPQQEPASAQHRAQQPGETLEQQRARDAWSKCQKYSKEQVNLAKSLPALIMNSGLMQTMAYLHEKGGADEKVSKHIRQWLHQRFPGSITSTEFEPFMEAVFEAKPSEFQAITHESFAWLRWLRQLAPARLGEQ